MIWVGFLDDGKDLDPNFKAENCQVIASMFLDIIKGFSFIHMPPSPIWRIIYPFKLFTILNPCILTGSSHIPTYKIWKTRKVLPDLKEAHTEIWTSPGHIPEKSARNQFSFQYLLSFPLLQALCWVLDAKMNKVTKRKPWSMLQCGWT